MALDFDGPLQDSVQAVCPLQCRQRRAAAGDEQLSDRVDWAGLPINLDFAFSPQQRDKVYAQHVTRRRWAQLRRRLGDNAQVCACETAGDRDGFSIAVEFTSNQ